MPKRIPAKAAFMMLAVATAGFSFAPVAGATPLNYEFTVNYASGNTVTGSATGTFSYDSSSVVAGKMVTGEHLLTALDYTIGGITYTAATANTGFLAFGVDGTLTSFAFGANVKNCTGKACKPVNLKAPYWFINDSLLVFSDPGASHKAGSGTITFAPVPVAPPVRVPEPGSLGLFGLGALLGGFFIATRRRLA